MDANAEFGKNYKAAPVMRRGVKGTTSIVGPSITAHPKPEDMKVMACPGCGRATVLRRRLYLGKRYVRTAPKPKGTVYSVRHDGICDKCWRAERAALGKPVGTRVPTADRYHHEMTEAEVEAAQERLRDYWIQRRLRGINPEGTRFLGDPR